jgi:ABC-2 type transport system permease protein
MKGQTLLIAIALILLIVGFWYFKSDANATPNLQSNAVVPEELASFGATLDTGTLDEEKLQIDEGNRVVVLDIPDDFFPAMAGTAPKVIKAYSNAGQEGQAQAILSVVNQFLNKTTLSIVKAPTFFSVEEVSVNAHNLRYIEFLLPGLIALSIMQMSVFSVAFVFTQYKEKGVLKRLLATPMLPYQFVTANVITRLFVALLQTGVFLGLGVFLFHANIIGSYLLLLLCVILGAVMFLGLGFTISGLSKTVDSVPAIANLVVFPMLFLGGTFFAISNMPPWLQSIAKFLPLTYFSTSLREVMTKGSGFF